MKLILPILLAVLGALGGVVGGVLLMAAPPSEETAEVETADASDDAPAQPDGVVSIMIEAATDSVYHPLERRLFVPFERADGRSAFATVEITLELPPDEAAKGFVEAHEPKVLDAFFRVLVGFAATGAFEESTRAADTLRELDDALQIAARAVLGDYVRGVLIANLLTNDA